MNRIKKVVNDFNKVINYFTQPTYVIPLGKHSYGAPKIEGAGNFLPYLMRGSSVGNYCSLGSNVTFAFYGRHDYDLTTTYPFFAFYDKCHIDSSTNPAFKKGFFDGSKIPATPITVENDVWIGNDVTIRHGITVGNGAVVAMNSLVVKDVPPYAIVGGNPAKIIKYRFKPYQIAALLKVSWWDWPDEKVAQMLPLLLSYDVDRFLEVALNENMKVNQTENKI
ncbi:MAG: CatB-related O-acetyltransferase [Candidatus Bathyarchaeia archaeon]|jgi:virginiamycin A acetyltransferase